MSNLRGVNPNQPIPINDITPVKFDRLALYLQGYPKAAFDFLEQGFTSGFSINFQGPRLHRVSKNLQSIREHPNILTNKLNAEISQNRIAGPFTTLPFPNLQISPLGLVPKKEGGEFRLIHHLSFPLGESINDGISEVDKTVQYETLDHAIKLINECGKNALLAKTDLESAFRLVPVHPQDYELLGMMFEGLYYYDRCLPMGCAISCQLFEKVSSALHWVMGNYFKTPKVVHVLDDFLFVGEPSSTECQYALDSFLLLCKQVGIPIKHSKTVTPTMCLTFLGIELDTQLMLARLPVDKVHKIIALLQSFLSKSKVSLKELQSLIGLLNFACRVVVPGRAFLRRLINLTIGLSKSYHHVRLSTEAKADLNVLLLFMQHFNNATFFLPNHWDTSEVLHLFTDASNLGYGGILGTKWFYGPWDDVLRVHHINIKELFPITVSLEHWGSQLRNKSIIFFSDNETVVAIINKQTSPNNILMILVRRLVLASLKFNIRFKARHIPGKRNELADALSRLQVHQFRLSAPKMDLHPNIIPEHLLQI